MITVRFLQDRIFIRILGVSTLYFYRFLEDLKATIHPLQRDYDPYSKSWMINEDALTSLIPLIQHYGASDHMLERCRILLRDAEARAAQLRKGNLS